MNEQNTALWERRLGDGLNALAEVEAPAATVTVADVIAAGRVQVRRRRNRAAFTLCAVLVLATALTAGALVLAGHVGNASPPATDGTPGPNSSIGTRTDPAAPTVAFGWLPSYLDSEYEVFQDATGPNYTQKVVPNTGLPPFDGPGSSSVQIWAPGDVILTASVFEPGPSVDPASIAKGIPAGTVRGHQAWWLSFAPGSTAAARAGDLDLDWQYATNAWATIDYHGSTVATTGANLLKIANNLVIGPVNAYPLPFHIKSLPSGMHAENADLDYPRRENAPYGAVSLRFCLADRCSEQGGGLVVSQLSTTWQNNSSLADDGAPMINPLTDTPQIPNTVKSSESVTVNGHSGKLWISDSGATLDFDYDASAVQIMAGRAEYKAIGGNSGLLAFAKSITWYGSDPARWTTNVIG